MGLLSRLLVGGGIGAAGGGLTAKDDEDVVTRALLGAASGAAIGGGVGGLLGRVRTPGLPKATQADWEAAVREVRKSMPGITPQQASQFPSKDFSDKLRAALDARIAQQYPQVTKRNASEMANELWSNTTKGVSRVTDDVWSGAESAAGRLNKNAHQVWDKVDQAGDRMLGYLTPESIDGQNKLTMAGLGAAGLGGAAYLASSNEQTDEMRDQALQMLKLPPGELGLRAFQAGAGMQPTGQFDDETKAALGRALAGLEPVPPPAEPERPIDPFTGRPIPKAPSLAPYRR